MAQAVRPSFSNFVSNPYRVALSEYESRHGRLFSQARNSFNHRVGAAFDPGNWVFSPEWWGTQGRGWGRNPGVTVFERLSHSANGLVTVTAHPASSSGLEDWPEVSRLLRGRQVAATCEWHVLRFDHETRQSVAKVIVVEEPGCPGPYMMQIPHCLAFEYLKSMVSVGLSSISCAGLNLDLVSKGQSEMRCLCIGLGGGSLPLFLAHKLKGCLVDVVEIDSTVISAATEFMGFPGNGFKSSQQSVKSSRAINVPAGLLQVEEGTGAQAHARSKDSGKSSSLAGSLWGKVQDRISGFEADGVAFVCNLLKGTAWREQHYDLVFIDAFDGKDEVPSCFWSEDGPFLAALCNLLNPNHGTAVMNLHTDSPPPSLHERITGVFGPGYDLRLPGGKQLHQIAHTYRNALLPSSRQGNGEVVSTNLSNQTGAAFTVAVPRQQNICLVASRGIDGMAAPLVKNLRSAAHHLEGILDIPFPMTKRVSRGFQLVQ